MDLFIQYAIAASQFAMDDARLDDHAGERAATSACSSRRASAGSPPSSASTRRCSRAARARSRRSSSPRRSSTSPPARCRSGSAPRGRTRRPAPPARRRRTPSATSFEIIQRGDADAMIAGGSEAAITPMGVGGFGALRALSTRNDEPERASRPFDKDRDGFIIGEGAGVLILEELEQAQAARRADLRRARRLRHVGRRVSHHRAVRGRRRRVPRDERGARERRHRAASRSTTSTRTAPRRRTTTSSRRWPSSAASASTRSKLAVSSTKSMTGHLLGAAGGLEAGITALAVHHQVAPPTINLDAARIPSATSTTCPNVKRADADRATRCRTRSASAAPTPRCCSRDTKR